MKRGRSNAVAGRGRGLRIVVLAAGKGTRMKSDVPKVLQPMAGWPLLRHVLETTRALKPAASVVVVGHGADAVRSAFDGWPATWALQAEQRGTGHAMRVGFDALGAASGEVLVLYGDVPLLRAATLKSLLGTHRKSKAAITVLTARLADPTGYGRVLRAPDGVRIVEHKDATAAERAVDEINTGIYVFDGSALADLLGRLRPTNAQGEYYLTDTLALAAAAGLKTVAVPLVDANEALGVNSMAELALAGRIARERKLAELMEAGVRIVDPACTYVDMGVRAGRGCVIEPNVQLRGATILGEGVVVEMGAIVEDSKVEAGAHIKAYSVIEESAVGPRAAVGPMAHLRPGSVLGAEVKVGNFVETKKARLGKGSKASHLSYIGDAEVGADVNIGCGTITCNYDGVHKHRTVLEDGVFIGSDTQLVAPVRVGRGAYVGSGSTITKDVPPDALAVSRTRQTVIAQWAARRRERDRAPAATPKPKAARAKARRAAEEKR